LHAILDIVHKGDGKGSLAVIAKSQETGDSNSMVPVEIQGDSMKIATNIQYIIDALNEMPAGTVQLSLFDKTRPFILRPASGDQASQYMAMIAPMGLEDE
jgi:DNA polymerase III sliding clamp (beta) subunit (PCNA family)